MDGRMRLSKRPLGERVDGQTDAPVRLSKRPLGELEDGRMDGRVRMVTLQVSTGVQRLRSPGCHKGLCHSSQHRHLFPSPALSPWPHPAGEWLGEATLPGPPTSWFPQLPWPGLSLQLWFPPPSVSLTTPSSTQ